LAADSLLPGAPTIVLSHRSDQLQRNVGQRESYIGVALPLWLPGQRDARQNQAQADQSALEAAIQAQRLKLAGELREAIWQLKRVTVQSTIDAERVQTARVLAEDVAKRVQAGELAKTDLNLAQNEWRSAQAIQLQNHNVLLQSQQTLATLTGTSDLPEDSAESVQVKPLQDNHPLLKEGRQAVAAAQAQVRVIGESQREQPELEFGTFRDRGNLGEGYNNSIELKLRIPLATAARNQPRVSAAQTSLTNAQSEYTRTRLTLEYQQQRAQQALHTTDQLLDLARQQRSAAQENLTLTQKAFTLGEAALFSLLQTRSAAFDAEQNFQQQEIAQALARARLNQAQGVLP
jgi:outer membrane protein TolC